MTQFTKLNILMDLYNKYKQLQNIIYTTERGKIMNLDGFIIVKTENDLPNDIYENTHHMYLCVCKSGKIIICRYTESNPRKYTTKWDKAIWDPMKSGSIYKANNIVAYKRITIPTDILALCTDKAHQVEYFDKLV